MRINRDREQVARSGNFRCADAKLAASRGHTSGMGQRVYRKFSATTFPRKDSKVTVATVLVFRLEIRSRFSDRGEEAAGHILTHQPALLECHARSYPGVRSGPDARSNRIQLRRKLPGTPSSSPAYTRNGTVSNGKYRGIHSHDKPIDE